MISDQTGETLSLAWIVTAILLPAFLLGFEYSVALGVAYLFLSWVLIGAAKHLGEISDKLDKILDSLPE